MRIWSLTIVVVVAAATPIRAENGFVPLVGAPEGPMRDSQVICPDDNLYVHHDGTFEFGGAWEGAGVEEPYGGAWGEGYELGPGTVDCVSLWHTRMPWMPTVSTDVYVWEGGVSGPPGAVLAVVTGLEFQDIPINPQVGRFDAEVVVLVSGEFTAGSWGNWPGQPLAYWWMWDENGPGGHPWTCIVPDLGWPEGWQNPAVALGRPVQSMGIGVHFTPAPIPARPMSWGQVKHLYVAAG